MKQFIQVPYKGSVALINVNHILFVQKEKDGTRIYLSTGQWKTAEPPYVTVELSYPKVLELINDAI
ncbi:hypothetical protein Barb6_02222 [Bacteroidales bacterium Barb6]|nr:hypothetical protein Barb6_02213 [Bacteroidales bacterium Barb6]OAV67919.1 hypothetical protein Barb6_02222 [Bacteroidales bacterium Barb6]